MKIEMIILGDAGAGKSRLCDWLLAHCPAKSVKIIDGERMERVENPIHPLPFDLTAIAVQTTTMEGS
jgi:ABC-type uncharacterized transport system ATPase subunit